MSNVLYQLTVALQNGPSIVRLPGPCKFVTLTSVCVNSRLRLTENGQWLDTQAGMQFELPEPISSLQVGPINTPVNPLTDKVTIMAGNVRLSSAF